MEIYQMYQESGSTIRYPDVIRILEKAVGEGHVGAHGRFWKDKSRDEFVEIIVPGFDVKLLVVGDAENSNLIHAIKGTGLFDGSFYPRMPDGTDPPDPIPDSEIKDIADWIDNDCPA